VKIRENLWIKFLNLLTLEIQVKSPVVRGYPFLLRLRVPFVRLRVNSSFFVNSIVREAYFSFKAGGKVWFLISDLLIRA
jgi:hypothetical protein